MPAGILGFTRFGAKGVEEIVVAKALDEEGTKTAERRLRTTLGHESGHGLLHTHLFALGARPESLFGDGLAPDSPKILCRDEPTRAEGKNRKATYRWWEYQANQVMGSLLLPKALVLKVLAGTFAQQGQFGLAVIAPDRREDAVQLLSETFDVNPIVARIRLEGILPAGTDRQLTF